MKFEQKLNEMHVEYRELQTKFTRTDRDLSDIKRSRDEYKNLYNKKLNETQTAETEIVNLQTGSYSFEEKYTSMKREL